MAAMTPLGGTSTVTEEALDFEAFYRREWPRLTALGWSLTGSWATAEELAQDAFADAYRRWRMVSGLERPGTWVRRAVINRSVSHHRRRRVESRGVLRLGAGLERTSDGAEAAADGGDVAFWDAVRALPARQAQCVALHYLEDRSVADIAAIVGCSEATVRVHLHRGRQRLATTLGAHTGVATVVPISRNDDDEGAGE